MGQWHVLVFASIVAYFVNDTGVAAMGMGIDSALGGILYVAIAAGSEDGETGSSIRQSLPS